MNRRLTLALVMGALALGGAAGSWATMKTGRSVFGRTHSVAMFVSTADGEAIGRQVSFLDGFVPVAKEVLPAVVNIASSKIVRAPNQGASPLFSDPFFRQFFGSDFSRQFSAPREERESSLGSGVIINSDGYILTNNHVIAGATDIEVSLSDKRSFKGKVVGADAKTDVAVVKINAQDLPVMTLGDSSKTQVGEFALAVGNPFGIGETMTMGIISATGRGGLGLEDYEDYLQTDAAINPGNSGGALVNVRGELIGLNTAILSGGGGNQGVGFAVPINMARSVMDQILKHGRVIRGSIGVMIQPVTPALAQSFGLTGQPRGALVVNVTTGSPAERADIQRGDIILELNDAPISSSRDLSLKVSLMAPGTPVKLGIFRDGKEREISLTLAEQPANPPKASSAPSQATPGAHLGLSVDTLTPQIAGQLGLPAGITGVVVTSVDPASRAAAAGLRRGDIIEQVDHAPVTNAEQFQRTVRQAGDRPLLLLINRGGDQVFVVVQGK